MHSMTRHDYLVSGDGDPMNAVIVLRAHCLESYDHSEIGYNQWLTIRRCAALRLGLIDEGD